MNNNYNDKIPFGDINPDTHIENYSIPFRDLTTDYEKDDFVNVEYRAKTPVDVHRGTIHNVKKQTPYYPKYTPYIASKK